LRLVRVVTEAPEALRRTRNGAESWVVVGRLVVPMNVSRGNMKVGSRTADLLRRITVG
jgi:hypothetical protein